MPRKTNRAEPASNRESAILDAALRLFATHGVDRVSMNELAEAVGIRKATLYHYFPGKGAVIEAIFSSSNFNTDRLVEVMGESQLALEDRLRNIGIQYLEAMRSRPNWQLLMLRESLGGSGRPWTSKLNRMLRHHIQGRIDALAVCLSHELNDVAPRRIELLSSQFFHAITGYWLYERHVCGRAPTRKNCEQYVELQVELMLSGIQSPGVELAPRA